MTMRWHYLDMMKEVAKKKMQEIYSQKEDERYKKNNNNVTLLRKKWKKKEDIEVIKIRDWQNDPSNTIERGWFSTKFSKLKDCKIFKIKRE